MANIGSLVCMDVERIVVGRHEAVWKNQVKFPRICVYIRVCGVKRLMMPVCGVVVGNACALPVRFEVVKCVLEAVFFLLVESKTKPWSLNWS